ncbi:MAG: hypothetical protein LUG49_06825 [Oscillospiraceae bacterium]|nr:hypothetical protein [Oscillospiraceae bacterium]
MNKKYEKFKMDITLFDGDAWMDVVTSTNNETQLDIAAAEDDNNTLTMWRTYK